jgi:protein ImuA
MIEQLRQTLQALEKPAGIDSDPGPLSLGVAAIDLALGGGFPLGALHEIAAAGEAHIAAAVGFAIGIAALPSAPSPRLRGEGRGEGTFRQAQNCSQAPSPARLRCASAGDLSPQAGRGKNIIWIAEDMALAESGAPYGPGLDAFGLAPERLLTVAAAHNRDLLWAMEEALRCRAVGVVIGELRAGEIDGVAVRRLSLAAAESGALALLLRASPPRDASTAATRWIVSAASSAACNEEDWPHIPFIPAQAGIQNDPSSRHSSTGSPLSRGRMDNSLATFAVELTRNRRGPLGAWILQWSDDDERFVLAASAQPVAAPAADRPHRQVA